MKERTGVNAASRLDRRKRAGGFLFVLLADLFLLSLLFGLGTFVTHRMLLCLK